MSKHGVLDRYSRSEEEKLVFDEEAALARIALVLAELLAAKGLTQRELAERIGVSEGRISQILGANSNPTARTLARIASALGCRLEIQFSAPPLPEQDALPWPNTPRTRNLRWERPTHDNHRGEIDDVESFAA